jgi:hypothetical protein
MEALAMVRPVAPERIDRLLEREASWAVPYGATVVIISAVMSPDLLEVAERLAISGHPIRGIYVGRGEAPEGTARVPIEDMGERFDLPPAVMPLPTVGQAFSDDVFEDDFEKDVSLDHTDATFDRRRI